MRRWMSLLLCVLLAACASAPPPAVPQQQAEFLFQDRLFAPPSQRISAADVFALSDGMKRYIETDIAHQVRLKGRQWALVDALNRPGQLKLEYDTAMTRNAAQAFDVRAGNCLSLVIMTAAFAKALDLQVTYQAAYSDETWSRSGNLYLRSGHVNLSLGRRLGDVGTHHDLSPLTIDFLPAEDIRGMRTLDVNEDTIVAMYMNNRAAEALVQGQLNDAYWWARAAMGQSPGFLSAFNTLGVIYLRHGDLQPAEAVFTHLLGREPDNTRAMYNLAQVLEQQGRRAEAGALQRRLTQIEPHPPFHFFNLGLAAMNKQDYRTARDMFAKEVSRAEYYHEFHFWLALAHFRLGEVDQARRQLALAMENSTTRGDHDLYAAKLAWLRSYRHP